MSKLINYGPAHPAVHGALRLILEIDGENIINLTPDIGYMHRGIEKLIENKKYHQAIPYFDRLDYVSSAAQEYTYVLAVEKLLNLNIPIRAQFIRVLIAELTRISNHLLHVSMFIYDCGAITPFVWAMEEREKIMWIFEKISGARVHLNYFRIGGVSNDISGDILDGILTLLDNIKNVINDIENVITNNQIFIDRTSGIGVITQSNALNYGVTGSSLRASGFAWDLRKKSPYDIYDKLDFKVPVGENGDCYDRYLVKILEMRESISIIKQCISQIPDGEVIFQDRRYCMQKVSDINGEEIYRAKYFIDGFCVPKGEIYVSTEAPKGEFGIFLVSDGSNTPRRCYIRSAGFPLLMLLEKIVDKLSDLPVVLASLDIVLGEVDR